MASKLPEPRGLPPVDLLAEAAEVLDAVDALPREVAGVLSFGDEGLILVEDRRICWAVAAAMPATLTELLSQQHDPPVPRKALEGVYRRCRDEHRPLGATLVESGLVSAGDVRAAFGLHHAGAIAQLARGTRQVTNFERAAASRDDRRFAFGTAEALAALAPTELASEIERARHELAELHVRDSTACAFVEPPACPAPTVLAVDPGCELGASQVRALARWAARLLRLGAAIDPTLRFVSGIWAGTHTALAWRDGHAAYAALCRTRPASAVLSSAITRRLADSGTSGAWPKASSGRP